MSRPIQIDVYGSKGRYDVWHQEQNIGIFAMARDAVEFALAYGERMCRKRNGPANVRLRGKTAHFRIRATIPMSFESQIETLREIARKLDAGEKLDPRIAKPESGSE